MFFVGPYGVTFKESNDSLNKKPERVFTISQSGCLIRIRTGELSRKRAWCAVYYQKMKGFWLLE